MKTGYPRKATNDEIKARFDQDVERFSDLEAGQQSTIDAPLNMELCTEAAKYTNPDAKELLDIGCGAGNKYREYLETLGGTEYAGKVFDYIAYEDTPRSLNYQLALLSKVGFRKTEILHKNSCFAAFGGIK